MKFELMQELSTGTLLVFFEQPDVSGIANNANFALSSQATLSRVGIATFIEETLNESLGLLFFCVIISLKE